MTAWANEFYWQLISNQQKSKSPLAASRGKPVQQEAPIRLSAPLPEPESAMKKAFLATIFRKSQAVV